METYLFLENKKNTNFILLWNSAGFKEQKFLQLYFWVLPF